MGMFFNEDINTLFVGGSAVSAAYAGSEQVWPVGLPSGTVFNFEYTGNVQSVELPRGKYKLQCWGAQGGTSYGSSNGVGSKGGYSEGVLTLTKTTTLYIFVGGQGSRGSSTTLVNGGWNGGGASVGKSSYNNGGTNGYSHPACGGGATDISTVTSDMSYSGGRTNRSAASLLARCIVAGGGAGGSYRHTSVTTTTPDTTTTTQVSKSASGNGASYDGSYTYGSIYGSMNKAVGNVTIKNNSWYAILYIIYSSSNSSLSSFTIVGGGSKSFSWPSGGSWIQLRSNGAGDYRNDMSTSVSWTENVTTTIPGETTTTTSSGYSNKSQQGGGTSGRGQYPGTQSSAGSGSQAGGFGYGANQPTTGNRYDSGAGGGGWYGGGSYTSDSSTSAVNYSGGGSGFVNTAANASYRPTNYTGLQLDSGTTIDGATSFESVSGSTETGHSGNGYARITVIK